MPFHRGPDPAARGRRGPLRCFVAVVVALAGAGCREQAPAELHLLPASSSSRKPPTGPWFVDRAHEFGLDVVTICGTPEKTSVLDSIGTGVALFDIDGDGDLDIF